jgi:hypothetical protein
VLRVLEAMRADSPEDPMWRGVEAMEEEPDGVRVRFRAPAELRDLAVGAARLRCHLYDAEAMRAAGRGAPPEPGTPATDLGA